MTTIQSAAGFTVLLAAFISVCHGAPIATDNQTSVCSSFLFRPPYSHLIHFKPLSGVTRLTRTNLNTLYRASLELKSSVDILLQELECRIGEQTPRPHHHCFLDERDEAIFLYNSTNLVTDAHRLAADLCLLTPFITALQSTLCYEQNNHSGEYADDLSDVRGRFDALLKAISNITGVPITTEAPPVTDSVEQEENTVHGDESRSPAVISGSHRNTRQANQIPNSAADVAPPTPSPIVTDSSDYDLLNQGRSRGRRQAPTKPPTVVTTPPTTNDRCSFPQSDEDQFIYIYELWISLWYLNNDLKEMTD